MRSVVAGTVLLLSATVGAVRVGDASAWPVAAASPVEAVPETLSWDAYKATFSKRYLDHGDEERRRESVHATCRCVRCRGLRFV